MRPSRLAVLFLSLALLPASAAADAESALIPAMQYVKARQDRQVEPGVAVRQLVKEGYVALKPERRMDYTDYRIVKKPATFLGHKLVVVEEEYLTKYVGCCVNAGIGAIVQVQGDLSRLAAFAKANACKMREPQHVLEDLRNIGFKPIVGDYAAISCRERDAMELGQ